MIADWAGVDRATLFTVTVFLLLGAITLAGLLRLTIGARGRILHGVSVLAGVTALVVLILTVFTSPIDVAPVTGVLAGIVAALSWLVGAAVARVRPVWVDALVILTALLYLTTYAQMAERAGGIPPIFSGVTASTPGDSPDRGAP